jgi:hypothetical protein
MGCRTCNHRDRDEIDQQIVSGTALRSISATFNVSLGALHRHKEHVKNMIRERTREQRTEHGSDLLQRTEKLVAEALEILATAKSTGNLKAAVAAIGACSRVLELIGKLDGSLAQPNAPGLHLTFNRVTNTIINYNDDRELAELISEATKCFDSKEIARLKALAESSRDGHTSAITIS